MKTDENKVATLSEIEFIKLIKVIVDNFKYISIVVIICTLGSIYYSLTAAKIYEVEGVIEVGRIAEGAGITKLVNIDDVELVANRLEQRYIANGKKGVLPKVSYVGVLTGPENLIKVKVHAKSNDSGEKLFLDIANDLSKEHKIIFDKFINYKLDVIKSYKREIEYIENQFKNKKDISLNEAEIMLKEKLLGYKEVISATNFKIESQLYRNTSVMGKVTKSPFPFTPHKKMIVISTFVISALVSMIVALLVDLLFDIRKELKKL